METGEQLGPFKNCGFSNVLTNPRKAAIRVVLLESPVVALEDEEIAPAARCDWIAGIVANSLTNGIGEAVKTPAVRATTPFRLLVTHASGVGRNSSSPQGHCKENAPAPRCMRDADSSPEEDDDDAPD